MRIATIDQRLCLVSDSGTRAVDVHAASGGQFDASAAAIYDRWDRVRGLGRLGELPEPVPFSASSLGSTVPGSPAGLRDRVELRRAREGNRHGEAERFSPVFTKFPSCITGPRGQITLPPDGHTDWEVELVVIIGRRAFQVEASQAWDYVAGFAVGQDVSERITQAAAVPPQWSMGKSFPGFGPVGPGW